MTFALVSRKKLAYGGFVCGLVALSLVWRAPAEAVIPQVPNNPSHYVNSGDSYTTAYNLGHAQAAADNTHQWNSWVVLDFGAQTADGSGTYLPSTTIYRSWSWDISYALYYALGYQQNGPHYATFLNFSTNNSGSGVGNNTGSIWGQVTKSLMQNAAAQGDSNVIVFGGNDVELAYSSYASYVSWLQGYAAGSGNIGLTNFGSADGCNYNPGQYQNLHCTADWYQTTVWATMWGYGNTFPFPEIYYNHCPNYNYDQGVEWANISQAGAFYYGNAIMFQGPMDQGYCNNSAQAWADLWNALQYYPSTQAGATFNYSTTI